MGRFARKFTDAQLSALLHATVDADGPGMAVTKAIDLAQRGELDGLEPFTINTGYAYQLVRKERMARAGISTDADDAPGDRLDRITRRLVTALDAGAVAYERRMKAAARRNGAKMPPADELARLARAGQEIRKLQGMRAAPSADGRAKPPSHPSRQAASEQAPEVEAMLKAHKATQGQSTSRALPDQDVNVSPIRAERTREGDGPPNDGDREREAVGVELHAAEAEPTERSEGGLREGGARADFRAAMAELERKAIAKQRG